MPGGPEANILGDGSGEQMRVLQNHAEIAAQVFDFEIADVDAADANRAALHFVESQQQAGEGGFPRAGVAHHGNGLARFDAEADVVQDPIFAVVGEPHVVEFHGCGRLRKGHGLSGRLDLNRGVQQLEHALGRGHGRLHDVVLFAQILDGAEKSHAVLEEGHHHADLESAAAHAESAVSQQQRQSQHSEKLGDGIEPAVGDDGVLVSFHVIAIDLLEFGAAARLAIEELQDGDAADMLLQIRIDAGDGHANPPIALLHGAPELHGHQHHQRHHRQQERGHARTQFEHRYDDEAQHQQVAQDHQQAGGEQLVKRVHVGGDARDQAAHRIVIVEGKVQSLQARHHFAPQVEHGFLPHPLHDELLAEVAEHAEDYDQQV